MKHLLRSFGTTLGAIILGLAVAIAAGGPVAASPRASRIERSTHVVAFVPPGDWTSVARAVRQPPPHVRRHLFAGPPVPETRASVASFTPAAAIAHSCRTTAARCGYRATAPPRFVG
jgi:hypothetical protein